MIGGSIRPAEPDQDTAAATWPTPATASDEFARSYSLPVKALLGMRYYLLRTRPFERKSPEAIADYQLHRLQQVVRVAAERVPYYQRRFREVGFQPGDLKSIDDLKRLPLLTRQDLKQHFLELFDRSRAREAVLMQTSGTTGQPTQFLVPREQTIQFLVPREQTISELSYHWRFWMWAGYAP